MTDDNSPPPSSRSAPRSRTLTARREEAARIRDPAPEHLEEASPRQLIQISPADGAPEEVRLSLGAGLGDIRSSRGDRHHSLGDRRRRPVPSLSLRKPQEARSIELDCNSADAEEGDSSDQLWPAPCTRSKRTSLASVTGDSAGFVTLASQPRIRKSSASLVLHARDGRHQDGSSRSTSQLHSDNAKGEAVAALVRASIPAGLHGTGHGVEPDDDGPSTTATPRVAEHTREVVARDCEAPLNLASTSTRRPSTGSKDQERTARNRRGLTIDISFAKSTTAGREGHILKSITTHVERMVGRLLQSHGEDQRPLSHSAKETAVIQPEGQGGVVVGVKITGDPTPENQPESKFTSKSVTARSQSLPPATLGNVPTTLVEDGAAAVVNEKETIAVTHQAQQPPSPRLESPHQKSLPSSTEKLVKPQNGAKPHVAKQQATTSNFRDADAKRRTSTKRVQNGSSSSVEKLSLGPKPDKDGATATSGVRVKQATKSEAGSENDTLATYSKMATAKAARKLQHEKAARKERKFNALDLNRLSQASNDNQTYKVTRNLISWSALTTHVRATTSVDEKEIKTIRTVSVDSRYTSFDTEGISVTGRRMKKPKPKDELKFMSAKQSTYNDEKGDPMITGGVKSKLPSHEAKRCPPAGAEENKTKELGDLEKYLPVPQLEESTPQETKKGNSAKASPRASEFGSTTERKRPCQVNEEKEASKRSDELQESTLSIHLGKSALQKSEKRSFAKATAQVHRVSGRYKVSQADEDKRKEGDGLVVLAVDLRNSVPASVKNEKPVLSGPKHEKLLPETGELLPSGPFTENDKTSDALKDIHATSAGISEETPLISESAAPRTDEGTAKAGDANLIPPVKQTASMRALDVDACNLPPHAQEQASQEPSARVLDNRLLDQAGKGKEEPSRHAESSKDTKHGMKLAKERKHSRTRAGQDGDYTGESPKTPAGSRRPKLAVYEWGAFKVFQAAKAPTQKRDSPHSAVGTSYAGDTPHAEASSKDFLSVGTDHIHASQPTNTLAASMHGDVGGPNGAYAKDIQAETGEPAPHTSKGKRKQSADTPRERLPPKVDSDIGPGQQVSRLSQQQAAHQAREQPLRTTLTKSFTSPESPEKLGEESGKATRRDSKIEPPESKPSIVSPSTYTAGESGTTAGSTDQKQKMTKQEIIAQAKVKRAEERANRSKRGKERAKSPVKKEKKHRKKSKDKKTHRRKRGKRHKRRGRRDEVGFSGSSKYMFCIILALLALAAAIVLFFLIKAVPGTTVPSMSTRTSSLTTSAATSTTTTVPAPIFFCRSKDCKREGSFIGSLLSPNLKPCDDFYSYVCDAWSQHHPTDPSVIGNVVSRDAEIQADLIGMLISAFNHAEGEDLKAAAVLYSSCTSSPEPDETVPMIKSIFSNWVIKEWPLKTGRAAERNSVWQFAAELARDLGVGVLLEVAVGVMPTAVPGETIVELARPRFLMDESERSLGEVRTLIKGAIEEALTLVSSNYSENVVREIEISMMELSKLPSASPPRTDDVPDEWISVPLERLDDGVHNFVRKVFQHIISPDGMTHVLLKSPAYIQEEIVNFVKNRDPPSVLNYMGFLVLVRLAPFFSTTIRYLRHLFARSMLGHSALNLTSRYSLCVVAVNSLLPNCIAKATTRLFGGVAFRELLHRLETMFANRIENLGWIGELSALYVRYRMRERRVIYFGPHAESCVPPLDGIKGEKSILRYLHLSVSQQQKKLQRVLNYTSALAHPAFDSDLDTEARYDSSRMAVHVPATIFNGSLSTKVTLFAFHTARVATRVYRALVRLVTEEPFGGQLVYKLTANAKQNLERALRCVGDDLSRVSSGFRDSPAPVQKRLRSATLEQATAIHLAFEAFRELLHVRRIWGLDYRLESLPRFSADQLFFIYLALDHCRTADAVYRKREDVTASPEYRVNFPLRHLKEFSDAFKCGKSPVCKITSQQ